MARAPVHIDDTLTDPNYDPGRAATLGARRIIGVPLLRNGVPLGAIVASWAEPGATPKRQEELLKTFADQAVIAIENARLFNETKGGPRTADGVRRDSEGDRQLALGPAARFRCDREERWPAPRSGSSVNVTRIADDHLHLRGLHSRRRLGETKALQKSSIRFRIAAVPGVREAVETRTPLVRRRFRDRCAA